MAGTIKRLLGGKQNIRIIAHNSAPERMPEIQQELKALAHSNQRLVVDERALNGREWTDLLTQTDIMVCPYYAQWYRVATSGVAAEAIAGGIPLVAPADTTLARWADEF